MVLRDTWGNDPNSGYRVRSPRWGGDLDLFDLGGHHFYDRLGSKNPSDAAFDRQRDAVRCSGPKGTRDGFRSD